MSHAFGPVDVGIGLGVLARVHASTAVPTLAIAVDIGAGFGAPQRDQRYYHHQYVSIRYRHVLVPHHFALYASATTYLSEARAYGWLVPALSMPPPHATAPSGRVANL